MNCSSDFQSHWLYPHTILTPKHFFFFPFACKQYTYKNEWAAHFMHTVRYHTWIWFLIPLLVCLCSVTPWWQADSIATFSPSSPSISLRQLLIQSNFLFLFFFYETYDAGGHIQAFSMQTNTASAKGVCLQITVLLNSHPWKLWEQSDDYSYTYGQ